jgi:hypothetical protein
MQLLGTSTTLWDANFEENLLETSISEGLALLSAPLLFNPLQGSLYTSEAIQAALDILLSHTLFRPPSFSN